jgi:hypothetical protein
MDEEVKERLLQLGYELKEGDGTALLFCCRRIEEHIKNVCNLQSIPDELYYKSVDMACGEFLRAKLATGELEGYTAEDSRLVKRITEGDTTVEYTDGTSAYAALSELINKLSADESELYSFRKMRW